ncbi:MAG: hypothetical protein J1F01_06070 [Oscillospiraceae bacterium]|nr:hypothetical protein [Oscillospiraceae bacterium]
MKRYIIPLLIIISTVLSSCVTSFPKGYEPENVDGAEVFYNRYSMSEPYKWHESEFWLSVEQKEEIYSDLSELKFKKTDDGYSARSTKATPLDEVVVMFWNYDHAGLDYHFYNGRVYYRKKQQTYVAEDKDAIVSKLRKWTAERFPELNEGDF